MHIRCHATSVATVVKWFTFTFGSKRSNLFVLLKLLFARPYRRLKRQKASAPKTSCDACAASCAPWEMSEMWVATKQWRWTHRNVESKADYLRFFRKLENKDWSFLSAFGCPLVWHKMFDFSSRYFFEARSLKRRTFPGLGMAIPGEFPNLFLPLLLHASAYFCIYDLSCIYLYIYNNISQ